MLRRVAQGVVVAVLLAMLAGLALPRAWRVERSVRIDAPRERVQPAVASLRRWQAWAPWAKSDPKAVHSFVGPEAGPGARWQWSGPTLGHGALTVLEATPAHVTLEGAIESDTVNTTSRFTFEPADEGTRVTWVDEGTLPRLGGLFVTRVEARLGERLERGLALLKEVVEREPPPRPLPPPSSLEGLDAGVSAAP
ncbi:MAG: SRPBCC family protein [Myxococcaceae bacterium]|nr:SRPBCC family protein [Myxococcaceae bacterium]